MLEGTPALYYTEGYEHKLTPRPYPNTAQAAYPNEPMSPNKSNLTSNLTRQARWKARNRDRVNTYQRELMRKRRANAT